MRFFSCCLDAIKLKYFRSKRLLCLVLIVLLVVPMGGCSFSFLDSQNLISPPKSNDDQQQIQTLLQDKDSDITYIYPKVGDYRSAIIINSFTSAGSEDALGFKLLDSGGVEVHFLTKNGEEWQNISSIKNSASLVDRVMFGDINGDGIDDVIIGWGDTQNLMSANACVYIYQDGRMIEYQIDASYGSMALTNFVEDSGMELFLVQRSVQAQDETAENTPARVVLYKFNGKNMEELASTEADSSIVQYTSLVFCKLSEDISAVVLDGEKSDRSSNTQIFRYNNGFISGYPVYPNDESTVNLFSRPKGSSLSSKDVDNDGYIEIPSATLLPALPEDSTADSTSFLIEWKKPAEGYEFETVVYTLSNTTEGYWFEIPQELATQINAINDTTQKSVTYNLVVTDEKTGEKYIKNALFTIKVFTQSGWEQRGELLDYEKLSEDSGYVYGILDHSKDSRYDAYLRKIKQSFQINSTG